MSDPVAHNPSLQKKHRKPTQTAQPDFGDGLSLIARQQRSSKPSTAPSTGGQRRGTANPHPTRGDSLALPVRFQRGYPVRIKSTSVVKTEDASPRGEGSPGREPSAPRTRRQSVWYFSELIQEPWSKPRAPNERVVRLVRDDSLENLKARPTSGRLRPHKRATPEPPSALAGLVESPHIPHLLNPYALAVYREVVRASTNIQAEQQEYENLVSVPVHTAGPLDPSSRTMIDISNRLRDSNSELAVLVRRYQERRHWWNDFARNASDPRWQSLQHYDPLVATLFDAGSDIFVLCAALCRELRTAVCSATPQADKLAQSCIAGIFILEKQCPGAYRLITESLTGATSGDPNAPPANGKAFLTAAGTLARQAHSHATRPPGASARGPVPGRIPQRAQPSLPTDLTCPETAAAFASADILVNDITLGFPPLFPDSFVGVPDIPDRVLSVPLEDLGAAAAALPFDITPFISDFDLQTLIRTESPLRRPSPAPFSLRPPDESDYVHNQLQILESAGFGPGLHTGLALGTRLDVVRSLNVITDDAQIARQAGLSSTEMVSRWRTLLTARGFPPNPAKLNSASR